jgi:hypothetical protein
MMTYIDPNLGVPLPEKSYADDCALTATNLWARYYSSETLPPTYTRIFRMLLTYFAWLMLLAGSGRR